MMLLISLFGCGSITTMDSARIVQQGTGVNTFSIGAQSKVSPLLELPYPIPSFDVQYRRRLGPDSDMAFRLLNGSPALDVRQRFLHTDRVQSTIGPQLNVGYLPVFDKEIGFRGAGFGEAVVTSWTTVELSRRHDLTFGLRNGLRFGWTDSYGDINDSDGFPVYISSDNLRANLIVGGGLRWERHGMRNGFAIALDVARQPFRPSTLAWNLSFQSRIHRESREKRALKNVRKTYRRGEP